MTGILQLRADSSDAAVSAYESAAAQAILRVQQTIRSGHLKVVGCTEDGNKVASALLSSHLAEVEINYGWGSIVVYARGLLQPVDLCANSYERAQPIEESDGEVTRHVLRDEILELAKALDGVVFRHVNGHRW